MKLFMLLFGLALAVLGILMFPAVSGARWPSEIFAAINGNPVLFGGACGGVGLGLMFAFIAGSMFARKEEYEPPANCPGCDAELENADACPACGQKIGPARFRLDTASLLTGIIGLVLTGTIIGLPLVMPLEARLLGILFLALLGQTGLGLLMGLSALLAERRKMGLTITGIILNGAVLGFAVFLLL